MLAALVAAGWSGSAHASCKLLKLADLPVTIMDRKPMVMAKINGADVMFAADSGAFYSMISAASAAQLKLKTFAAPDGLRVMGVGGSSADVAVTKVKSLELAGIPLSNVEFLVGGGEIGGGGIGGVGLLGQNVFRLGDVEYDLANGAIRLFREEDCSKTNFVYWSDPKTTSSSEIDIRWTTPLEPHTSADAFINGVKIRVIFDTGADSSFLSVRAARRAGIPTEGPGVTYAGYSRGIGRQPMKTWVAQVASFKLGDEEIRNTHLRLGESIMDSADMLLGIDFFLSHRIYVASKQHQLFFTYNGGPVFNLTAIAAQAAAPAEPAIAPSPVHAAASLADPASASVAPAEAPKDAADFSRRGMALAARHDFQQAITDLSRACELAPDNADYSYDRGVAYGESNQPASAVADFDRAIQLNPAHVPAHVARAELRLNSRDAALAIEDLNAADAAAAKEADVRLRMARAYAGAGMPAAAVAQLNLWIAAHGADARQPEALSERCGIASSWGQELHKALDDCNAAIRRIDKKNVASAHAYSARGLVRLRLGDYDKSISDYDAALALQPKNAWALYGRGVDEMRRGKTAAGQSDMTAATAIWEPVAKVFAEHSIAP